MSKKWGLSCIREAWTKRNKKVLYYFTIFAIVNELLIIKNRYINPIA